MEQRQYVNAKSMEHRPMEPHEPIQFPQSQMQRFKDAGLNPHLIYGKGTAGNASHLTSANVQGYNRPDMKNTAAGYTAFRDTVANVQGMLQAKGVQSQMQVNRSQANLNDQKAASEITRNSQGKFDLKLAQDLRQTSVDARKAELQKLNYENEFSGNTIRDREQIVTQTKKDIKATIKLKGKQAAMSELNATIRKWEIEMEFPSIHPRYIKH